VDLRPNIGESGLGEQLFHSDFSLDASSERMAFYRRTPTGEYAPIAITTDGIVYSMVRPDFCFRVGDLHRQPSLIEMATDPVYLHFVLPEYQVEKQRAERMAARLRKLGVDGQTSDSLLTGR
jgi:hypothetical protein